MRCRRDDGSVGRKTRRRFLGVAAIVSLWASPVAAGNIPQQIIPQFPEVGLGNFSMPGTTATGLGAGGSASSTGGSGTAADDGLGDSSLGGSSSTATAAGSSSALDTMMGTSWGAAAASNATALGVNPSALAATCVVESGCQNVSGTGSITGAFQMTGSTYTSSMNAALAQNPNLATNAVSGIAGQNDPATQSIAAAEYLKQGADYLQNQGVDNPTTLQVRGYYNFGPANGAQLAQADDNQLMSTAMQNVSQSTLTANGITSSETVGQWRQSVASKMGSAANQAVLTGTS